MFPAFAHFRRTATRDTEVAGQQIREATSVMWYRRVQPRREPLPGSDRFDVRRNPEHQAFGAGGPPLLPRRRAGRLELRIMFEETLARYPEMGLTGPGDVRRVRLHQPAQDAAGDAGPQGVTRASVARPKARRASTARPQGPAGEYRTGATPLRPRRPGHGFLLVGPITCMTGVDQAPGG